MIYPIRASASSAAAKTKTLRLKNHFPLNYGYRQPAQDKAGINYS